MAGTQIQSVVDRLRYQLRLLPRVKPLHSGKDWLPKPYKAALVISADFELGWAWRYARSGNPVGLAHQSADQTRQNFPALIDLFDRYDTPITWATVGHLFLDHCERQNDKAHANLPRPPYFKNEYWSYQSGDWYDADPCSSLSEAPDWYAPDLITMILAASTRHEIGCHTFSHIDCSEEHCPPALLDFELLECRRIAEQWGIDLKTLIYPGFINGNFSMLKKNGFQAYRWHTNYQLGIPQRDEWGMWRIPGGILWEKPAGWSVASWCSVTRLCIDRALETNTLIHFWFHPSCASQNVLETFPDLLEYVQARRKEIWIVTMGEMAEYMERQSGLSASQRI